MEEQDSLARRWGRVTGLGMALVVGAALFIIVCLACVKALIIVGEWVSS